MNDPAEGLDSLDARFLRTLAEVQRAYRRSLPARELQVRVERWCARLALEGANSPPGLHRGQPNRGTCPPQVLKAQGAKGSSRRVDP